MKTYNTKQISSKYRVEIPKNTQKKSVMSARFLGTGNFSSKTPKQKKCLFSFGLSNKKLSTTHSFSKDEKCFRCQLQTANLQCLQCGSKYFCQKCSQQIHKIGKFQFHTTKIKENRLSGFFSGIRSEVLLKKYHQKETNQIQRLHNNMSQNNQKLDFEQQKQNNQNLICDNLTSKNEEIENLYISQHYQSLVVLIKNKISELKESLSQKQQELINNVKNSLKTAVMSRSDIQHTQPKNKKLNKSICPTPKTSTEIDFIPLIQFSSPTNKKNQSNKMSTQSIIFNKKITLPQINHKIFSEIQEFINKLSWRNMTLQNLDSKNLYTERSPKNERKNLRSFNNRLDNKLGLVIQPEENSNEILLFSPKFSYIAKKQSSKSFISKTQKSITIIDEQKQIKKCIKQKKQSIPMIDMTSPKNQRVLQGRATKRFIFPYKV